MSLVQVMFYVLAAVVVGSAFFVASTKNLVRSIFMFFITLLGLAGLYVLCLADFVAVTQIVIYVGGVLVLILFAFMLSGKENLELLQKQDNKFISLGKLPALLLAGLFFIVMVNVLGKADVDNLQWVQMTKNFMPFPKANDSTVENIGVNLMTFYLLPFESISILLMMALIGAAHLARKERGTI
ncbi:NADH-quinone oxidoreductase subunit J [Mucilaginibacter sp. dw_454]|uniref:NADH-quinone oxidoreductase subunit J family protein n=1 Tax=Mucilaginibacter sp. dw_454 TaxID=2720079 RepID=UPI001BD62869|nr:NADH-quinone oxidoreductase subunit J [Mucilaginibacter sp. dw_454]